MKSPEKPALYLGRSHRRHTELGEGCRHQNQSRGLADPGRSSSGGSVQDAEGSAVAAAALGWSLQSQAWGLRGPEAAASAPEQPRPPSCGCCGHKKTEPLPVAAERQLLINSTEGFEM